MRKCYIHFTSKITDPHQATEVHFFETTGEVELEGTELRTLFFFDEKKSEAAVESEITFFFEKESIIMQRVGEVMMEQRFTKGEKTQGIYRTEHGTFSIQAETLELIDETTPDGGIIEIKYHSYVSGELSGATEIKVSYQLI